MAFICEYTKNHGIVHFKWEIVRYVNYISVKLSYMELGLLRNVRRKLPSVHRWHHLGRDSGHLGKEASYSWLRGAQFRGAAPDSRCLLLSLYVAVPQAAARPGKARAPLVPRRIHPELVLPGSPAAGRCRRARGRVLLRGRVPKLSPGGYLMTVFLPPLAQQRVTDLPCDLARAAVP